MNVWHVIIICIVCMLLIYKYIKYYIHNHYKQYENQYYIHYQSKTLLKEMNNKVTGDILFPSIRSFKKILHKPIKIKAVYPIIVLPDIGKNPLYAKWNMEEYKHSKKDEDYTIKRNVNKWTKIWFDMISFMSTHSAANAWKYRFLPVLDEKTGLLNNSKGTKVKPNTFGSISELYTLATFEECGALNYTYLFKMLEKTFHYNNESTLFCASYDFRRIFNPEVLFDYFEELHTLIFDLTKNFKKVIIIGDGLGNTLFNLFLHYYNYSDYIEKWIVLNSCFSGNINVIDYIENGKNTGIGITQKTYGTNEWYKDIYKNISGIYGLLPNHIFYDLDLYYKHFIKCVKPLQKLMIKDYGINMSIINCNKMIGNKINYEINLIRRWIVQRNIKKKKKNIELFNVCIDNNELYLIKKIVKDIISK